MNDNIIVNKQIAYKRNFSQEGEEKAPELVVKPPKNSSSNRLIPVHPKILEELKIHREWHEREMERNNYHTDYIFTTASGGFVDRHDVQHAMERYYNRIGIEKKKFHAFRATFALLFRASGVRIASGAPKEKVWLFAIPFLLVVSLGRGDSNTSRRPPRAKALRS